MMTMRNLGIGAIAIGVLVILLSATGVIAQDSPRAAMIAAVVVLAAGIFLYRRPPAESGRPARRW